MADRKIRGIATPACALVRNDMFYFSAINTNLSDRTDVCLTPFRGLAGADGTEQNRNALAAGPARQTPVQTIGFKQQSYKLEFVALK